MVHVSFDRVEEFVPRVPQICYPEDNNSIKRICVNPTVLSALQSIPQCGKMFHYMKHLGLPIIIHAYYLKSNNVMSNEEVSKYVPDVKETGEMWILDKSTSVHRVDYEIKFFYAPPSIKIGNKLKENFVSSIVMKRCKFQSNVDNVCKLYESSCTEELLREIRELFKREGYRSLFMCAGEMTEKVKLLKKQD